MPKMLREQLAAAPDMEDFKSMIGQRIRERDGEG
jgi:hypothetical protein